MLIEQKYQKIMTLCQCIILIIGFGAMHKENILTKKQAFVRYKSGISISGSETT